MGSLNVMSDPVESGDDFEAVNIIFTVHLTELHPETLYYHQVIATNSNASTLSDTELFQTDDRRKSMCTFSLVFPLYLVSIVL